MIVSFGKPAQPEEQRMADFTSLNPGQASGWSLFALTQIILGQSTEAFQAADRAVKAAPDSINALIIQGYAFQAVFDMDRALASFQQALRIDGKNVLALVNLARLQFGMDLSDQALENLEKAQRLAPLNGDVYNLQGFVLLAGRRTDDAIAAFQKAVELDSSLGEPHMGLGLAYMRKDINDMRTFSQDLVGPPPMTVLGKTLFTGANETPYKQLQGQFLFKAGAALYFDRMENGDPLYKTAWTVNALNPRAGLIFAPTERDTFRLAVFRYLLPYITSRIDPMDIGGIPVMRNNFQGASIREGDIAWEREWRSGFLSVGGFYLEKEYTHQLIDAAAAVVEQRDSGRMQGAEVVLNQLLRQGLGLAASYRYQRLQDESLSEANREDHRVTAGLKYVHALGFSAGLSETYRHSRFEAIFRDDEDIWLTDVKIGYEFPGKKGSVSLECRNLFDQRFNWITDYFVFAGRAPSRETILTLSVNF